MPFLTYQDAIDAVFRYLGAGPSQVVLADVQQAVDAAYRELYNAHNWTYYEKHGRLNAVVPFTDGTISYAPATLTATLTTPNGVVFPAWTGDGYLRVGTAVYRVDKLTSPTTCTLIPSLAPVVAISDSPYTLYQDSYLLPQDFIAGDQLMYENAFGGLTYTHPREWLFANRYIYQSGIPQAFTITGDEKYPGRLLVRIFPIPQDARTLDFVYKRKPRDLVLSSSSTGTVSVAGLNVTGNGTSFTSGMVGSVFRAAASGPKAPTAYYGTNPAAFESVVTSVTSATSLTLSDSLTIPLNGVGYIVSDLVDIEYTSMSTAFSRCCEMMVGMTRILKDKPDARAQYKEQLTIAKEHDSRSFSKRFVGDSWVHRQRAKDMPLDLYPTYK